MSGLSLHCGSKRASEDEVRAVPIPEATRSWVPVGHGDVLDHVQGEIVSHGMQVVAQDYGLWNEGAKFFGLLEVRNGNNAEDYGVVIGLRNSIDKSLPVGLALGSHVFCCDNLSFWGEVTIQTKHTRYVWERLPGLINRAVGKLIEQRHTQDQRIEAYKACQLDNLRAHDLIVRAVRSKVVCPSVIGKVIAEWDTPSHVEFQSRSVWSLFNAFTEVLKQASALDLPKRTMTLHGLCDAASGLVIAR